MRLLLPIIKEDTHPLSILMTVPHRFVNLQTHTKEQTYNVAYNYYQAIYSVKALPPIIRTQQMCFSTVLLEVKHTGTSRACVSDLVPVINHNSYKLVLDK